MSALDRQVVIGGILDDGFTVKLTIDSRGPGVVVPREHVGKAGEIVLEFGRHMAVPIRDLDVGEDGISGTLSFNRSPLYCTIPWAAVVAAHVKGVAMVVWKPEPSEAPKPRPKLGLVQ